MVQMLLDSVELYSFKGKTLKVSFNEDSTDILGTNGSGKGVLAEAICWGLTGEPLYGDKLDLFTKGDVFTYVTVSFSMDDKKYILTRELKKTNSGASGTIRLDHEAITSAKLNEILKVPPKLLKALIFPRTFMVGEKDFKTKVLYGTDSTGDISAMEETVKSLSETLKELEVVRQTAQERVEHLGGYCEVFKEFDRRAITEYFGNVSAFVKAEATKVISSLVDPSALLELEILREYSRIGSYGSLEKNIADAENYLKNVENGIINAQEVIANAYAAERKLFTAAQDAFAYHDVTLLFPEKSDRQVVGPMSYMGLPLAALSGGESIQAACKVHQALEDMCETKVPIVIENAGDILDRKVLTSILPDTQCILEFLNDSPLAVGDKYNPDTATCIGTAAVVNRTKIHKVRTVEIVDD